MRRTTTAACLLFLLGCGSSRTDSEPATEGRGARREAPPAAVAAAAAADQAVAEEQAAASVGSQIGDPENEVDTNDKWYDPNEDAPPEAQAAAGGKTPQQLEEDARVAALHNGLGSVISCFPAGYAGSLPDQININVTASAGGTGTITRAEVSGAGLTDGILACVKNVVLGQHLPPSSDSNPYTTSTTLTFNVTKKKETKETTTIQGLPTGDYKPPAGYSPPASTLPAQAPVTANGTQVNN